MHPAVHQELDRHFRCLKRASLSTLRHRSVKAPTPTPTPARTYPAPRRQHRAKPCQATNRAIQTLYASTGCKAHFSHVPQVPMPLDLTIDLSWFYWLHPVAHYDPLRKPSFTDEAWTFKGRPTAQTALQAFNVERARNRFGPEKESAGNTSGVSATTKCFSGFEVQPISF